MQSGDVGRAAQISTGIQGRNTSAGSWPVPAGHAYATRDAALPRLFSDAQWQRLVAHFQLTPRQSDIARLICRGHTYKAIAMRTGISINTVRMHIRELFDKVRAHDRVSVVVRLITTERTLPPARAPQSSTEV